MEKKSLTYAEAKRFSITDYLSKMGFEPTIKRGHDWWYLSPLRIENTASFKVDTKLNLWYDHGQGEGGTILTLGAKLERCTDTQFKDRLAEGAHAELSFHREPAKHETPERKVEVVSIQPLTDAHLLAYLKARGIEAETAKAYCKEIDFNIARRNYKAIGFQNRSGGFELRNSWFKGGSSPKDISIINEKETQVAVFEGFMDFLSFVELKTKKLAPVEGTGFIILNSVSLASRTLDLLVPTSKKVHLYLDNDLAGSSAKQKLTHGGLTVNDHSHLYISHKDLNEYLMTLLKTNFIAKTVQKRSRRPKL